MKNLLCLLGVTLIIVSCAPGTMTSKKIAKKCQQYHEADGAWYEKEIFLVEESKSVFTDYKTETIELRMDNPTSTFEYNNLLRGVHLEFRPDTCIAYNDSSICEDYDWAYKFYPYIWGMPSKFFDPGVEVEDAFEEDVFNDVPVYVIHIDYENEYWDYYINKESFYLEGFRFDVKNGGGEIVYNEGVRNVNGIIMPTKRTWYDLDMKLLGTGILN